MFETILVGLTQVLTGAVAQSRGFGFYPPAQRIYYANHSSHLDTLLIWSHIPPMQRKHVRPAAAKDYWWSSPWRRFMAEKILHAVPVMRQRENPTDEPCKELEDALAQGDSLIFFPEGTRGHGASIQPFKNGLYHLVAKYPHVTLVPVYINNLNRVLPKGEFLPVPILCTITFGGGFTVQPGEEKTAFTARAYAELQSLVTE